MLDSDFIVNDQQGQEEVLFDSGGTSDCYRLVKDNRIYCIKRPKPQYRNSEAYMSLFKKEFELGIDLEHPNIVRYFAYDTDERGPFIRMDYVDGDNLEEFVAQHPDYLKDKNNQKQFLDELFSAIAYLHDKGLLHLDLKPRNILITNKGHHVKLIDLGFGWSESFVCDLGFTRDYCAPEQLAAKTDQLSPATDIYALGKILQHFGLAKDSVLEQCLKEEPKDRYQSVADLGKALQKSRRSNKVKGALLALAVLSVAGALAWLVKMQFGVGQKTPIEVVPEGAVNGLFTINPAGDQVYFSKGNLQYRASTETWRFAEDQLDFIGKSNVWVSPSYERWIDLFYWGTSGFDHGAIGYQPWSRTTVKENYYAYGRKEYSLNDSTGLADWGSNAIINGGNEPGLWRTLTHDEWNYVLRDRHTLSGKHYTNAYVDGYEGLLLLPDDWDTTIYHLNKLDFDSCSFHDNEITLPDWKGIIEPCGVVFLNAAGIRHMTLVALDGEYGSYWSSTYHGADPPDGDNEIFNMYYSEKGIYWDCLVPRWHGSCVRLVREKQDQFLSKSDKKP